MQKRTHPLYLANKPCTPNADLEVTNKFTGEIAAHVPLANNDIIEQAIAAAVAAQKPLRQLPAYKRAEILNHVAQQLIDRAEELARVLAIEAGKPIKDARGEITRGIDTFRIAAEEATRIYGQYAPLDISPRAEGYESITKRFPIGPCSFIAPFNFPINLAAHKIAPAIAAGCPFVLKPASFTPISALILGEILAETDLPPGAFSILPCRRSDADLFTTDSRFKLLSFTGSPEVGWQLKAKAGKKQVILELGGNAACVVDKDADIDYAVSRIIIGAFYQSGQSCISVQRIFIHGTIYDLTKEKLARATAKLTSGNPLLEETFIGPMITEDDSARIESWIKNALTRGAALICGGTRTGPVHQATLIEHVPDDCELSCKEAFGPVAILEPFSDFAEVCNRVNDSSFGLQAGIFTANINSAFYAFNEIEVGGVVINDIPSFRVDSMPYGGVKDSGLGREGVRFAIEHLTEPRLLILNRIGHRPQ